MNSFTSAIRRHSRGAALVLLPFLTLICGIHPALANGVNMAVGNGQIVYGTISGTGLDQYTILMPTGTYGFQGSLWESGGHSTTSNAEFSWVNPNGLPYGGYGDYNYDAGVIAATNGVTGTWTFIVGNAQHSMTAAAYAFQPSFWPGTIVQSSGQAGGAMQPGVTYSGTTNVGETDFYSYQGITGPSFTMTLTKTSGGSGYCPWVRLFTPTGGNGGDFSTCTSTSPGKYASTGTNYLVVENSYYGNGTGSYTLEISGTGVAPTQGKDKGSTCLSCEAAKKSMAAGGQPPAQSGPVVSNGAAATTPTP